MDGIESEIVGVVAALKTHDQKKWLSLLAAFADQVAAKATANGGGKCACGTTLTTCMTCSTKAMITKAVPDAMKAKAIEALQTLGPAALMKGMEWLDGLSKKPDTTGPIGAAPDSESAS